MALTNIEIQALESVKSIAGTLSEMNKRQAKVMNAPIPEIDLTSCSREAIATAAMQALIAREGNCSPRHIALKAVRYADALIEALNEEDDEDDEYVL